MRAFIHGETKVRLLQLRVASLDQASKLCLSQHMETDEFGLPISGLRYALDENVLKVMGFTEVEAIDVLRPFGVRSVRAHLQEQTRAN